MVATARLKSQMRRQPSLPQSRDAGCAAADPAGAKNGVPVGQSRIKVLYPAMAKEKVTLTLDTDRLRELRELVGARRPKSSSVGIPA
jgi:hypothetical protein